jgi:hypothetical protein
MGMMADRQAANFSPYKRTQGGHTPNPRKINQQNRK